MPHDLSLTPLVPGYLHSSSPRIGLHTPLHKPHTHSLDTPLVPTSQNPPRQQADPRPLKALTAENGASQVSA